MSQHLRVIPCRYHFKSCCWFVTEISTSQSLKCFSIRSTLVWSSLVQEGTTPPRFSLNSIKFCSLQNTLTIDNASGTEIMSCYLCWHLCITLFAQILVKTTALKRFVTLEKSATMLWKCSKPIRVPLNSLIMRFSSQI